MEIKNLTIFIAIFFSIILEWWLSSKFHPLYYRYGIPLLKRALPLPYATINIFSQKIIPEQINSDASSLKLSIKAISNNEIAIRRQKGYFNRNSILHGLIILNSTESSLLLTIKVNWTPLVFLSYFALNPHLFFVIYFYLAILVIQFMFEKKKYIQFAQIIADYQVAGESKYASKITVLSGKSMQDILSSEINLKKVMKYALIISLIIPIFTYFLYRSTQQNHDKYVGVWQALNARDFNTALNECTKVIQLYPNEGESYELCARTYMEIKNYSKTIEFYKKAMEKNPSNAWYLIQSGFARIQYGDLYGAVTDLDKAITLKPEHSVKARALSYRGNAFMLLGEYSKADNDFTELISSIVARNKKFIFSIKDKMDKLVDEQSKFVSFEQRELAEAHVDRAALYEISNKSEAAIADYDDAINNNYKSGDAYFGKAKLLKSMNKTNEADENFKKAINYYTGDINDSFDRYHYGSLRYVKRGRVYLQMNKGELAFKDFEDAVRMDQDNVGGIYTAYIEHGQALSSMKQYSKAIEKYDKAIELCPYDPNAHLYRGISYMKLGKTNEAMYDYNKAIKLSHFYPEALYERALLNIRTNNKSVGIRDLQSIIKNTNTSHEMHKKALLLLK